MWINSCPGSCSLQAEFTHQNSFFLDYECNIINFSLLICYDSPDRQCFRGRGFLKVSRDIDAIDFDPFLFCDYHRRQCGRLVTPLHWGKFGKQHFSRNVLISSGFSNVFAQSCAKQPLKIFYKLSCLVVFHFDISNFVCLFAHLFTNQVNSCLFYCFFFKESVFLVNFAFILINFFLLLFLAYFLFFSVVLTWLFNSLVFHFFEIFLIQLYRYIFYSIYCLLLLSRNSSFIQYFFFDVRV